jgi:transcriptional regulator with XRE-family HTH domain
MQFAKKKKRWIRPKFKINHEIFMDWFETTPLNRKELADLCQVSNSTISRWLKGERTPRPSEQHKLCEITSMKFNILFIKVE